MTTFTGTSALAKRLQELVRRENGVSSYRPRRSRSLRSALRP